ncbi:MAG: RDD family protein [Bdellovibrionaceae bacterium]|nr:RDD family protein [Pseudobdellovibrionaceae bacterium]
MHNEIDPFEEFEFKPITDGLGFHRNQKSLNEKSTATASQHHTPTQPLFSTPLPNKKSRSTESFEAHESLSQTHDIVDEILKNIETSKQKAIPQFEAPKSEPKIITSRVEPVYKPSGPLLTAMLLDLMLVVASTLLFLVALLAITKIDLLQNIKNPDEQGSVYISMFLLFCSVGFMYYVCFRAFLGYTPGEWAYDQKIFLRGGKVDFLNLTKIALRSVLIIITGGFIVPLISWAFDKDIIGNFLDLPLVRRK